MKVRHVLILLLLGINCTNAQKFDSLDKLLESEFRSDEPGGIVLIKKGEDIVFQKALGIEDIDTKTPITANTIFNTGSISKTFVGYGILILESEGKLSIEDSITKYFSDFTNSHLADKVKIKHLLSHTSGLPDIRKVNSRHDYFLTAKDKENFEPIKSMESLNFEPGKRFEYSNPAFNGLALITEEISGKPWQEVITKKIFEPSGMLDSKVTDGAHPETDVAHAYIKNNGEYEENDYGEFTTFAAAGNGGIWCSILDLVKYEEAIREAKFLDKKGIVKSREIYIPGNWDSESSPNLGFSWFISASENNEYGVKLVSHTGSQGGFRSFHYSVPEKELTYIGLFNRPPSNMNSIINEGFQLLEANNWMDNK